MQFWTIYALSGALFIDILCPYQEPSNRWRHEHKPSWTLRMNTNLIFLQPASRGYWWFLRAYSTLMYTQFSYIRLELNVWYFAVRVLIYWVTCFVIDKSLILWIYGPDFRWCYLVWLSKEQNCLATQGFLYFQVLSNFFSESFCNSTKIYFSSTSYLLCNSVLSYHGSQTVLPSTFSTS